MVGFIKVVQISEDDEGNVKHFPNLINVESIKRIAFTEEGTAEMEFTSSLLDNEGIELFLTIGVEDADVFVKKLRELGIPCI